MSIKTLQTVGQETRRLAIAGSSLACGDFRLKKLIAPLEKSGEKAPVFAKAAQAAANAIEADEKASAKALLDLATLTNAVLYTRGTAGMDGELEAWSESDFKLATQTSYRVLAPLIEALTKSGGGRQAIIEDAWKRGAFDDLRLVEPAVGALADSYSEIAEFMTKTVVPSFGPIVWPLVRRDFDIKGGKVDGRRLRVMIAVDRGRTQELCRQVVDEGKKELRLAAIEGLAGSKADIDLLLELSKDKTKDVRHAAYLALSRTPVAAALNVLKAALTKKGKEYELVEQVIPGADQTVFAEASAMTDELLERVISGELSADGWNRLISLLRGIHLRGEVTPKTLDLLVRTLPSVEKTPEEPKEPLFLRTLAGHIIADNGGPAEVDALAEVSKNMVDYELSTLLKATARNFEPDEVFRRFSAEFKDRKKGKAPTQRQRDILNSVRKACQAADKKWSLKWLELAIELDLFHAAKTLAIPGHKPLERYLTTLADAQGNIQVGSLSPVDSYEVVIALMMDSRHPRRLKYLEPYLLEQGAKAKSHLWRFHTAAQIALPDDDPEIWPKVEEMAAKLPENCANLIHTRLADLRANRENGD